ncbi:single-stranded DNA-binding protein [Hydrogenimonas sp.]
MLPQINHVFRMTRDPELVYGNNGLAICRVGLVASEKRNNEETQLWMDATAFGKTAELLHNVKKGQRVFVQGRLKTEQWTDRNGARRSSTRLIIDRFEYIEKRGDASAGGYGAPAGVVPVEHQDASGKVTSTEAMTTGTGAVDIDEDDIPF